MLAATSFSWFNLHRSSTASRTRRRRRRPGADVAGQLEAELISNTHRPKRARSGGHQACGSLPRPSAQHDADNVPIDRKKLIVRTWSFVPALAGRARGPAGPIGSRSTCGMVDGRSARQSTTGRGFSVSLTTEPAPRRRPLGSLHPVPYMELATGTMPAVSPVATIYSARSTACCRSAAGSSLNSARWPWKIRPRSALGGGHRRRPGSMRFRRFMLDSPLWDKKPLPTFLYYSVHICLSLSFSRLVGGSVVFPLLDRLGQIGTGEHGGA